MEVIWGRNATYEALRGRRKVYRIYLAANVESADVIRRIETEARGKKVTIQKSPRQELDRLAGTTEHQGVVAQVEEYTYSDVDDILSLARERSEPPFILILDSLQDPHNFGSLLRTAESVGVHGAIIPKRRAVDVTPSVVKSSAGAVEHLRVAQVANLTQTIEYLKKEGVWVVGVDATGTQEYDEADLSDSIALVVGGEGAGIGRLVRESCDYLIRLPMRGQVSSLNAAVAGSVVLYEVDRQRRHKGGE